MSCGPIVHEVDAAPRSSAVSDTTRGSSSYQVSVPPHGRRRPACHRARPQVAGTCARRARSQPIGGAALAPSARVTMAARRHGRRASGALSSVDGWSAGTRRHGRAMRRSMRIESSTSAAKSAGAPADGSGNAARADDDHRAVEVEDPQGLDRARFVLGVEIAADLPASEIGVLPDTVRRSCAHRSWWCSPTCRRGRCVGMLCRRSRRWRCPTGRSRRPIPAAR